MKNTLGGLGIVLFWLLWPALFVYFKFYPYRSRVLVVAGNEEFLAVRPWLDSGNYLMPGGGIKRGETVLASAVRELREETGIDVPESSLQRLGRRRFKQSGLSYVVDIFVLELSEKPNLKPEGIEIMDLQWLDTNYSGSITLALEVSHALRRYKPLKQPKLL